MNDNKQIISGAQLLSTIKTMALAFRSINYQDGRTPRARNVEKSKRQKTKRGAKHVIGQHFKPVRKTNLTPAQYRSLHNGNPQKYMYESAKWAKRAMWIYS